MKTQFYPIMESIQMQYQKKLSESSESKTWICVHILSSYVNL